MSAKSLDMRRSVRYKKRNLTKEPKTSPRKKVGHHYKNFKEWLLQNPTEHIVQMDTVEGTKGGKVLLTLFWCEEKLMLAFLLDSKAMDNTVAAMNRLEDMLGDALFNRMLPVILTDNGTEFADPELFEYRQDGTRRTHLFYCQPRCSDQKGVIEKNHEYIRYIVPHGTSLDGLTQEKVDLMMSHINSTKRPGLGNRTPIEVAMERFGTETIRRMGLTLIPPDDVNLTAKLVK
ncbi:hypothetical protein [Lawsonibacter hominis]|uniref:hypothetical protein n=1 Tax=Lawsonibacter hominis TaxID=2763053 RepID=UPI00331E5A5E